MTKTSGFGGTDTIEKGGRVKVVSHSIYVHFVHIALMKIGDT